MGKRKLVKKIEEGIYSLDSYNFDVTEPLIIIVHPFYLERKALGEEYIRNIENLISEYKGPILTLEEKGKFWKTVRYYSKFENLENRLFVKTENYDPEPVELCWEDLFDFLSSFKLPFYLAGGQVLKSRNPNKRGCLGYTAYRMRRAFGEVEYLKDCIF